MSQQKLLIRVVEILELQGIPYMLTGSFASSLHGEPRASHDIDLVIQLAAAQVPTRKAAFPEPDFYLPEAAMREAIVHRSMFNLLSTTDGDKVDFWLLTETPFDRERFARRRPETILGRPVMTSTPEDTILMKLRWCLDCGGNDQLGTDCFFRCHTYLYCDR